MTDHQPPCPYCGSPFTGPAAGSEEFEPDAAAYVCHECGRDFALAGGGCSSGSCGGGCSCADQPDQESD